MSEHDESRLVGGAPKATNQPTIGVEAGKIVVSPKCAGFYVGEPAEESDTVIGRALADDRGTFLIFDENWSPLWLRKLNMGLGDAIVHKTLGWRALYMMILSLLCDDEDVPESDLAVRSAIRLLEGKDLCPLCIGPMPDESDEHYQDWLALLDYGRRRIKQTMDELPNQGDT